MRRAVAVVIAVGLTACQILLGDLGGNEADDGPLPVPEAGSDGAPDEASASDGGDAATSTLSFDALGISPEFNGGRVLVLDALYEAAAVASSADGLRTYVGGTAGRVRDGRDPSTFGVVALDASGTLAPTFGSAGFARLDRGLNDIDRLRALAIDDSGRLLLAGAVQAPGKQPLAALARLMPDGGVDPSFNDGGVVVLKPPTARAAELRAVALTGDGRIVIAGRVEIEADGEWEVLVTRHLATGERDPSWPFVYKDFGFHDGAWSVGVDRPSGAVTFVGDKKSSLDASTDGLMARYLVDAALDPSFAVDGRRTLSVPPGDDVAFAMAVLDGGNFYVAGAYGGEATGFVMRLFRDAGRDPSFGQKEGSSEYFAKLGRALRAVTTDAEGRAIVAGYRRNADGFDEGIVARFALDGTLDATFGEGGIRVVSSKGADVVWRSMTLAANGAIVAVGAVAKAPNLYRAIVVRYD